MLAQEMQKSGLVASASRLRKKQIPFDFAQGRLSPAKSNLE